MNKDDDLWDDDFTDYRFNEILFELEANGEILKKWEQGEPIEKEPKTETKTKRKMKKEKLFNDEIFSEKIYNETRKKYEQMAEQLPDLLASISAEGLPTDWKFIDSITHNEGAFREWVDKQGQERQKGKFLTVAEIQRNADELNEFYNRVAPYVNAIRRMRIERLPLVPVDDSISVDMDKVEELAKKEATTKIDATKMQNYWEQVNKVVEAIGDLEAYEEKNGLPDSTFNPASISMGMDGVYMTPPNLSIKQFQEKFSTPERFQDIYKNTFKKN